MSRKKYSKCKKPTPFDPSYMKMERARTEEDYFNVMTAIDSLAIGEKQMELARILTLYFSTIAKNADFFDKAAKNTETSKGGSMLLDNLKALKAKFIEEGIEQGIEKGIEKNRLAEEKR